MNSNDRRYAFLQAIPSKKFLIINIAMALFYFIAISFFFKHGNTLIFITLIAGEVFHVLQILGYAASVWSPTNTREFSYRFKEPVNIFVTVAGEPTEIVRRTLLAARNIDYPNKSIYILNDGYVAGKKNWREMIDLARELKVGCITRQTPGGAKAGNINHGLTKTNAPFLVIFDADHVPKPDFLKKTIGFFIDKKMGFVQTPQFYNNQSTNIVTQTAWDQQALFFGPIMNGKNRTGSVFMCGTNMVLRREALLDAGGMCEFNIAEDFLTSLFMHERGWKSTYVPEVLAEGLAPEDFLSYYKQQFRWTRGSLEVIFKFNPLFRKGLTMAQKLQYVASASYYLSGVVVLIDALIPLIFLFTGATAIVTSSMTLAIIFIPYIFLSLYILQQTSNATYTFRAISFSIGSFYLQIRALIAVLLNQKTSFVVTSKNAVRGNFLYLSSPHLLYIGLTSIGTAVAINREGVTASLLANLTWAIVNIVAFLPFIMASAPEGMMRRLTPFAARRRVARPAVSFHGDAP